MKLTVELTIMKLNFNGLFELNVPVEKAFDTLTDPASISSCIPDLEKFEILDDKNFNAKVKAGIGFVRGSFDMKCSILELSKPSHSKFSIEGSGIPGKVKIQLSFDLKEKATNSTVISWAADSELSGLITGLGETILRKTTEAKVQEILNKIKEKLEK